MMRRILQVVLPLMILAGCSSLPSTLTPVEWQSHQAQLQQIKTYKISGKLGYISPKERRSFNFQWNNLSHSSQLRLTTFLGQTVLKMDVDPEGARVETYNNQVYTAKTPEALLAQLTGLNIPLSPLSQWILGRPTMADSYTLNAAHTLDALQKKLGQHLWQVHYQSYTDIENQHQLIPLPNKLSLTQAQTKINIQITQWKLNP